MARMVLYLCQHGDALAKETDPDRPLSERGTTDICNVANVLADSVEIGTILHSGKTRASQTAELLRERLAPQATIRKERGLGPNDPVEGFAAGLASYSGNLLVVGHMPFVGRLASHLLCHGELRDILAFQPGTVAAFHRDDAGYWLLAWMVTPALC